MDVLTSWNVLHLLVQYLGSFSELSVQTAGIQLVISNTRAFF